jgi:hypothetical protein
VSILFWSGRLDLNQRPPEPHSETDGKIQNNNEHFSVASRCHVPRQIRTIQSRLVQIWCRSFSQEMPLTSLHEILIAIYMEGEVVRCRERAVALPTKSTTYPETQIISIPQFAYKVRTKFRVP